MSIRKPVRRCWKCNQLIPRGSRRLYAYAKLHSSCGAIFEGIMKVSICSNCAATLQPTPLTPAERDYLKQQRHPLAQKLGGADMSTAAKQIVDYVLLGR